jgi:hypothetical protein
MREQIFSIIQTEPEIIYDPTSVNFSKFQWTNGYYNHVLTQREIEKPYLISLTYYSTVDYEDIILLVNNIADIWKCAPGTSIKVPKIEDVKSFMKDYIK